RTSGEKRVFLVILFTSFSGSLVSRIPGAVHTLEGDKKLHSSFGIMGNNGEVYLSGLPKIGNLKAVWGDNSHCHASYHLSDKQGVTGIFLTRAVCM
ncbi:TPA: FimD/PapC C-terminal domain-containing protein, partial [Escherichia coli]